MKKKILFGIVVFISLFIIFMLIKRYNTSFIDTIKYNKKTYYLLEYNTDIFTYYHNSNKYYEEDLIHPVTHNKWDVVYFNGDLFILNKEVKKAINYYKNDINYDWYVVFDNEDNEIRKTILINNKELSYLYNIEKEKERSTIVFKDIDMFADILKISKDGLVQGIITLVQVDGIWYYKTEIMTDDDREYVIKITDTLNEKINKLI